MQEAVNRPVDRDRLSVLLALLVLSGVLFRFIELPEQVYQFHVLGSPLEICASETLLLIALMVGLTCTGTTLVLHDHPPSNGYSGRPIYVFWILPGVLAGLSAYLLSLAPNLSLWIGGLVVFGISIGLTVSAEHAVAFSEAGSYRADRLALNVLAYLMAFVLFVLIYETRTRSLVTATLTLFTATLLALDLLSVADVPTERVLPFAGIVGLVVGQSTWALNYWRMSAWVAGLLLLLIFYAITNLAHQHLLDRLKPSALVEFGVVILAVLFIVMLRGP